jgi:hypothetical protein
VGRQFTARPEKTAHSVSVPAPLSVSAWTGVDRRLRCAHFVATSSKGELLVHNAIAYDHVLRLGRQKFDNPLAGSAHPSLNLGFVRRVFIICEYLVSNRA